MKDTSWWRAQVPPLPWWVPAATFLVAAGLLSLVPISEAVDPVGAVVPALGSPTYWLGLAVLAGQALALLRHPSAPVPALALIAVLAPVAAGVGLSDATGATSIAIAVAAYRTVLSEDRMQAVAGLVTAGVLVAVGQAIAQARSSTPLAVTLSTAVVQGVGILGLSALVGAIVRSRRETLAAQQEQVQALAREHAALVREAVARERTSMARELHDIAAHHLSGIAVMTGAIRQQIDSDPEGAKDAVQSLREQSTAMLRDMRGLVGMLRDDRTALAEVGPPAGGEVREESVAGIRALVSAARDRGAQVLLEVHERPDGRDLGTGVGPLAQLSAYRTVQEALANITRHADGAHTEVLLDGRDPTLLRIEVGNDRPAHPAVRASGGAGFGLVGMRERAELTDARLRYGPTDDGGWFVSLTLPVTEEER